MPELAAGMNKFQKSEDTTIISQNPPVGDVGIAKTSGDTGIFVYSQAAYSIWFKSGGTWTVHQTFTSEDLIPASAFRWAPGATHVYFQTSELEHSIYVHGRDGALLIDNTPSDGTNEVDALVLDATNSLKIFGTSETVTTITTGTVSSEETMAVSHACPANITVTELVSGYSDSLSSNLAGYYKFNNETDDSGPGGYSGTLYDSGNATYPAGKIGDCLSCESNASYVGLNNPDLLDLGSSYTISAWVYSPSTRTYDGSAQAQLNGLRPVFSNMNSVADYITGLFMNIGPGGWSTVAAFPNNNLQTWFAIGSYWLVFGTPQDSMPLDQWVHVAMTVTGADTASWTVKFYINGQNQTVTQNAAAVAAQPWGSDSSKVNIGAATSQQYPSSIAGEQKYDEVAIWKRELTQAEITSLYNSGNGSELDLTYQTTETVRNDFTATKTFTVTAPAGIDPMNIKVTIEE